MAEEKGQLKVFIGMAPGVGKNQPPVFTRCGTGENLLHAERAVRNAE